MYCVNDDEATNNYPAYRSGDVDVSEGTALSTIDVSEGLQLQYFSEAGNDLALGCVSRQLCE
jgi:hypothetical protein